MTPEQQKRHEEQVTRFAQKNTPEKKKEVFTLLAVATVIFILGLSALGTLIYNIKKNNPHHSKAETMKILNMNYDEVQAMQKVNK